MVELSPQSNPQLLTRRSLMQSAAVIGMAAISEPRDTLGYQINEAVPVIIPSKETSTTTVDARKKELYAQYGVIVISAAEARELTGFETEPAISYFPGLESVDWTVEELGLLEDLLGIMPSHFLSDQNEEKPYMALDYLSVSACNCGGFTFYDTKPNKTHGPDVMVFDKPLFQRPTNFAENNNLVQKTIHEPTHRWDLDMTGKRIHEDMREAFGGSFKKVAKDVSTSITHEKRGTLPLPEYVAYTALQFGFRGRNAFGGLVDDYREVIASLAEIYPYGEGLFVEGVSSYTDDRTAMDVYGVLRDKVFLGTEYNRFPEIYAK